MVIIILVMSIVVVIIASGYIWDLCNHFMREASMFSLRNEAVVYCPTCGINLYDTILVNPYPLLIDPEGRRIRYQNLDNHFSECYADNLRKEIEKHEQRN